MIIDDLDRPIEQYFFAPWQRTIAVRAISSAQFVVAQGMIAKASDDGMPAAQVKALAFVCSCGVVEPQGTADEWESGTIPETLSELGNYIISKSARGHVEAAKKN